MSIIRWISVRGPKEKHTTFEKIVTPTDVRLMLDGDFRIIELLSLDFLLIHEDYLNYDRFKNNSTASAILGRPVYGPAIILEPKDFDPCGLDVQTLFLPRKLDSSCPLRVPKDEELYSPEESSSQKKT